MRASHEADQPEIDVIQLPDGTETPVRVWRGAAAHPVIALWPGIGVAARYYDPFAERLNAAGFNVIAAELRGQGESRPHAGPRSRFGLHLQAAQDHLAVEALARRHFPLSAQFVLGHSLGGQIAALYASRPYSTVSGLILVASGTSHFTRSPRLRGAARYAVARIAPSLARARGYAAAPRIGRQSAQLVTDVSRVIVTGRYEPDGADIDYEAALAHCRHPVLSIRIPDDPVMTAGETECLLSKFVSADVERVTTEGRWGHNRWARHPDEVATLVAEWIARVARNK